MRLRSSHCGTADSIPVLAGIGLRHPHLREIIERRPPVGWLEVHSENYMSGGAPLERLMSLRRDYPISLHGVGLSLGSAAPPDIAHLARLRDLARRLEPTLLSEHVAWSISDGIYFNDLLPLPYTEESLDVLVANIGVVQDTLGRPILVENPSTYLRFRHSTIPEPEFIAEAARRSGCGMLLDINNAYVSACNHGFDAAAYLAAIPGGVIGEIHLAGHAVKQIDGQDLRIDDHGSAVAPQVWDLYAATIDRIGPRATLVEWDSEIPALATLIGEADKAQLVLDAASAEDANALAS